MGQDVRVPGQYKSDEDLAKAMLDEESKKPEETKPEAAKAEPKKEAPPKPPTWEERLAAVELTPDQAFVILDAVLEKGFYERTFPLYGGRISVTLRTRDGSHRQRVANALDELRTNDPRVHGQVMSRMFLAGSLVRFNKDTLDMAEDGDSRAKETAFQSRLAYVDKLSDPVLDTLFDLIARFDGWTFASLSNGAPTGF
jgi:hypothetical protein